MMSAEALNNNPPYDRMGDNPNANPARFRFAADSGLDIANINELRRIMLSDLAGIAIRAFGLKIRVGEKEEVVLHRYCAVDNLREDMATLIRNLRRAVIAGDRYKSGTSDGEEYVFESSDFGVHETELVIDCGKLFEKNPAVRFVDDGHPIMTLVRETNAQNITLRLKLFFDDRPGFVEAKDNKFETDSFDVIPIDAQHSPVTRCAIHEDETTNCVLAEIETNGAIAPEEALNNALMQSSSFSLVMP